MKGDLVTIVCRVWVAVFVIASALLAIAGLVFSVNPLLITLYFLVQGTLILFWFYTDEFLSAIESLLKK
jgi:hypothetical protein